MNTFLTSTGAVALVKALVDFMKYIRAGDRNGWITQLCVWLFGILVVLTVKISDIAAQFDVGPVTLADAKAGTIVLAGMGLGAVAMLANTGLKALDNAQSAATPSLIEDSHQVSS